MNKSQFLSLFITLLTTLILSGCILIPENEGRHGRPEHRDHHEDRHGDDHGSHRGDNDGGRH